MATYSWNNGTSGTWNWTTATDWSGGTVPPNDGSADIVIDAPPANPADAKPSYTVLIQAGETETVKSISINKTADAAALAGTLEVDGTLAFAPGSPGLIDSPFSSVMIIKDASIVNAGTIYSYVQSEGVSTFTGTNAVYIASELLSLGTTTIDTAAIGEYGTINGNAAPNTLSDGIFEAKGTGAVINLGGTLGGLTVDIETVSGPNMKYDGTNPGFTILTFDGPGEIDEWLNGTYVPVESTITTVENNATIQVNADPLSKAPRNYTTTNKLTIGSSNTADLPALFYEQGGTLTTGGLTILGNGTLSGAPTVVGDITNDGTVLVSGGEMILQGSVTGAGTLTFDTAGTLSPGTLDVHGIGSGENVALLGGDTLIIESPTDFKGTVSNVGTNAVILTGVTATNATWTGNTLNIFNGTSLVDTIAMSGTAESVGVTKSGGNTTLTLGGTVSASPPTLTAGASASYAAGGTPATLDSGLTVSDAEAATLIGATVVISAGFLAGDTLTATAQNGISSSFNAGTLTLTGTASLSAYQTELDSVAFSSTAADPTGGGSDSSRTISWTVNDGQATATATSSLSVNGPVSSGSAILFQNDDGQLAQWQVNGTTVTSYGYLSDNPGASWFAMGTGAFFTGDTSDAVWQNQDGSVAVWQVKDGAVLGGGVVDTNPGTSWQIKGTGDFYGDRNTDILWQNQDGSVAIWDMQGTNVIQYGIGATNPGSTWQIKGTGDFYGDGNTDILWQNQDGSVAIWDMKGTNVVQYGIAATNPGTSWRIVGTGDFYGDGNTDILWQNDDGSVAIWDMHGTDVVKYGTASTNPGSTWHVVGTGNYFGDGNTDIVWQNNDGSVAIWDMQGTDVVKYGTVANPGNSWNIIGNNQMRFISSGAANETLAATPTTPDEFIFTNAVAGQHTITGFDPMEDIVQLSGANFADFSAVQSATTTTAGGALVNLGNGSSLLLSGVDPTSLHASNFALS